MDLITWQDRLSGWHSKRKHDQVEELEMILYQVPSSVFGPDLTDAQSKALACWLDGCLRLFQQTRYQHHHKAFQTLQYTCAKLEQAAIRPTNNLHIRDWCLRRLQHLTVLALEFCSQQDDKTVWKQQATKVIQSHIALIRSLNWNESGKHDHGLCH